MYTCFRLWSTQLNVGPVLHVLGSEDTKCLSRWKWVGKPKAKVEIWSFSLKWNPISFLKTKPEIHKKSSKIWQNGKGSNALNFCYTKFNFDKPNPNLVNQIQIWYAKFIFRILNSDFSLTLLEKPFWLTITLQTTWQIKM